MTVQKLINTIREGRGWSLALCQDIEERCYGGEGGGLKISEIVLLNL